MSRSCAKCRGIPNQEVRIGAEWLPVCSKACGAALVPTHDIRARIGRALDAALIGPEQDAAVEPDAFAEAPDEVIVEILKSYPPSTLLRIAGANLRLRSIVLDPRVIAELVDDSFERKVIHRPGHAAIDEWLELARRAANTNQAKLVEAIVDAIDARQAKRGDVVGEKYTAREWQLTRFALAVRSHNLDFATRMMAGMDPADVAGFVPYAMRLDLRKGAVATLRTLLACLRRADVLLRFTLGGRLSRNDLFYSVELFTMLLQSGNWAVEREDVESNATTMLTFAPGNGILVDAITKKRADIVQLLVDDGRLRLGPYLITSSTTEEIAAILLRSRAVNPFGATTLAEFRALQQRSKDGVAARLMYGYEFEW